MGNKAEKLYRLELLYRTIEYFGSTTAFFDRVLSVKTKKK